jgi:hypothetical protein
MSKDQELNEGSLPRELTKPVVAGTTSLAYLDIARTLPLTVDDAQRAEGFDLYDRMYNCIYVKAPTLYLRDRIYEQGLMISPAVDAPPSDANPNDDAAKEFALAVQIAAFVSRAFEVLGHRRNDLMDTLREMHTWVRYGQAAAEITFERIEGGEFAGMTGLKCVRYLPRKNYRMVADPYGPLLGAIGISPRVGGGVLFEGVIKDPSVLKNFLPISRMLTFIVNPSESGPGGESLYRSAYDPWKSFMLSRPVEMQNQANFAGQSLIVTGPEKGETQVVVDGKKTSLNQMILEAITGFNANSSTVLPFGSVVHKIGGDKVEVFSDHETRMGRQMVMSILYSARTLLESNRNSQADAKEAADIGDIAAFSAQDVISRSIRLQLVRALVIMNYGRDVADRLTPKVSLRRTSISDVPSLLSALAQAVSSGMVTEAMLESLWPLWFGVKYIRGVKVENQRSVAQDETKQNPRGSGD